MFDISFEKIDSASSGRQDALYIASLLMLLGGAAMLFTGTGRLVSAAGLASIFVAILGYVWLLKKTPKLRYFRYFWLDQDGVHHIEGNSPTDRVSHFTWDDIQSAEAAPPGDDFRGLVLTLRRRGMQGVPVLLTMDDADEAAAAIRQAMESSFTGLPHPPR